MQANFCKISEFLRKEEINNEKIDKIIPKYANIQIIGNCVTVCMSIMFENKQTLGELRKASILRGVPMFMFLETKDANLMKAICPELEKFMIPRQNPMIAIVQKIEHRPKHHPAYKGIPFRK